MIILFLTAAVLLGLAAFTDVVLNAREGMEDESGFHAQPIPVKSSRGTRPVSRG